jgi:putative nucleotidyltransferase with HDIG domain
MRPRSSLRNKIILPFLALLLFVGLVGTLLVTIRVTTSTVATFEGSLLRASLLGNDHLAVLEAERLAQLRAAIDTQGVAAAVASGDAASLGRLLGPLQANSAPAQLVIRVLGSNGGEILTLTPAAGSKPASDLHQVDVVGKALTGQTDARGDKYVFLQTEPAGLMLYWVGPVRADSNAIVGAIALGESMTEVAGSIRDSRASELVFYDPSGKVLLSSLNDTPSLTQSLLGQLPAGPVRVSQTIDNHPFEFLVGPWRLRDGQIGYLATALRADAVESSINQVRLLMVGLFGVAALLTLLFGNLLARRLTRPVEQLVTSTRSVAAGDLTHRASVQSNDEIGVLAQAFNAMTQNLEVKTRELEESYFASIHSLARAIDARDPYTFGHSTRVASISLEIADQMGLAEEDRKSLRRAALLHDIGKIGVEDRILRKPGPLTDEEWHAMRQHPMIGYRMLSGLGFLKLSLPGVLHHHERWDGQGYPTGLRDQNIIPYVRILSVADTLDAMTSDRPYRVGFPFERAVSEIRTVAGAQFDPNVVEALLGRLSEISVLLMAKTGNNLTGPDQLSVEEAA